MNENNNNETTAFCADCGFEFIKETEMKRRSNGRWYCFRCASRY